MAKRKSGVNVSAAVKAYMAEHPEDKPQAIADAVGKQIGAKVEPGYVSNIRSGLKAKKGKAKTGRRSPSFIPSNGKPDVFDGIKAVREGLRILGHARFMEAVTMLTDPMGMMGK